MTPDYASPEQLRGEAATAFAGAIAADSVLDDRFDMLLLYGHLDHLARAGGVPDSALADRLARALDSGGLRPNAAGLPDRLQGGIARFEFHRAHIDLAARQ